jgi:nicotinamidase-related amidase
MNDDIKGEINKAEKSALVVWDVQKALVERIFNKEEFLGNVSRLIEAARKQRIPVFFSRIAPLPERFESAPRRLLFRKRMMTFTPEGLELVIPPTQDDVVVPKNTASIFIGTNFELMVRNAGITTLFFAGISTEFGIESSGRDAFNRGFFTVIAKDAVSSPSKEGHERSLQNMENLLILMTTREILEMWNA